MQLQVDPLKMRSAFEGLAKQQKTSSTSSIARLKKVQKAKRKKWQELCNSINDAKNMAWLNKVIARSSKKTLGLLTRSDGTPTRSIDESIELAMRKFFPGSTLVRPGRAKPDSTVIHGKILYGLVF